MKKVIKVTSAYHMEVQELKDYGSLEITIK